MQVHVTDRQGLLVLAVFAKCIREYHTVLQISDHHSTRSPEKQSDGETRNPVFPAAILPIMSTLNPGTAGFVVEGHHSLADVQLATLQMYLEGTGQQPCESGSECQMGHILPRRKRRQ